MLNFAEHGMPVVTYCLRKSVWHCWSSRNISWWIRTARRKLSDTRFPARDTCWTMPSPCLECPAHATPRTAPNNHHIHQRWQTSSPTLQPCSPAYL